MSDLPRAAGVAIMHGNSVLLAKRIKEYEGEPVKYGGYWSIFGGMVEEGENPMKAACRELYEESKIETEIYDLRFIKIIFQEDVEFVVYAYEAPELVTPTLNFEHTEYGWFDIKHLNQLTEEIDEEIIKCIYLHKKLQYENS